MITRIVKLTISPSKKEEFRTIFITNKEHIRSFEGCLHVELLQDKKYFSHIVNGKEKSLLRNTENQSFLVVFGKKPKLAFALHLKHGVQMNYLACKLLFYFFLYPL
jgi:hypothetical protein